MTSPKSKRPRLGPPPPPNLSASNLSICENCNLVFIDEKALKLHQNSQNHQMVQNGMRPPFGQFFCFLCWEGFKSMDDLRTHYNKEFHEENVAKFEVKAIWISGNNVERPKSPLSDVSSSGNNLERPKSPMSSENNVERPKSPLSDVSSLSAVSLSDIEEDESSLLEGEEFVDKAKKTENYQNETDNHLEKTVDKDEKSLLQEEEAAKREILRKCIRSEKLESSEKADSESQNVESSKSSEIIAKSSISKRAESAIKRVENRIKSRKAAEKLQDLENLSEKHLNETDFVILDEVGGEEEELERISSPELQVSSPENVQNGLDLENVDSPEQHKDLEILENGFENVDSPEQPKDSFENFEKDSPEQHKDSFEAVSSPEQDLLEKSPEQDLLENSPEQELLENVSSSSCLTDLSEKLDNELDFE